MDKSVSNDRSQMVQTARSIAIILVLIFHYFQIVEGKPIFIQGALGVDIFFCISGFVIWKSIGREASPVVFCIKRYNRILVPIIITIPMITVTSYITFPP